MKQQEHYIGCLREDVWERKERTKEPTIQFYTTNMFEVGNEGGWMATPWKNMYALENYTKLWQTNGENIG